MLLDEVEHAAGANDIDKNAVDRRALVDRHFGLRDRAVAGDVATEAAIEVQDVDAFVETLAADFDKFFGGPLEPCGVHPAFRMPDRFESLPVPGITPQDPVLDGFADCEFLSH